MSDIEIARRAIKKPIPEVAKRLGILPEAGVRDLKGPEAVQ